MTPYHSPAVLDLIDRAKSADYAPAKWSPLHDEDLTAYVANDRTGKRMVEDLGSHPRRFNLCSLITILIASAVFGLGLGGAIWGALNLFLAALSLWGPM